MPGGFDRSGGPMVRVISYVDGFNLYFGLREAGWKDLYWLNMHALSARLAKHDQQVVRTKYFTSRISRPRDKVRRQSTLIEAIRSIPECEVFFGHYLSSPRTCANCGYTQHVPTEKMTDVNIATEMLIDAFTNSFDVALLISGDSDLTAPINAVRRLFPTKRVVVAFPPNRFSTTLARAANGYVYIERNKLAQSQFPDEVRKADGYLLRRPAGWA
jgi:uncharacterized LabA/DUF88 family protein